MWLIYVEGSHKMPAVSCLSVFVCVCVCVGVGVWLVRVLANV